MNRRMDLSKTNIYPLSEENLQALLAYYVPYYPKGNLKRLNNEIRSFKLTLKELEYSLQKIIPLIPIICERLNTIPTQANILDYSIETFLIEELNETEADQDRIGIIETLKDSAGIIESYENSLSVRRRLFTVSNWN